MSRVYETAIKIGASISKAFGSDTKIAADSLKKLSEATKQLKTAEKAAAAYKKLDDELTRSKSRYNAASDGLRRLKEAEQAAGGATKESTAWRRAGERAVAASARQFDRASKAAAKNGEALRALGVDTSKAASEHDRLTRALAATERQEKALERYEKSRERLFGTRSKTPLSQKAGEQLRGVASDAMLLGTAAVGAGAAMAGLVLHTLKAGDEIGDTADKLGIASTALQELRYGARQSGAEVEDLDRAIAKMAVNIGKHKMLKGKGGGTTSLPGLQMLNLPTGEGAGVVDPFKQIGLNAKELATLKPEEQFKKIADGLAKLKTHADRAAIAQEIFGKGATSILPYLAEGSTGIEKLSQSAHKYGGVLSEAAVAAADAADKAMRDAEMAVAGLTATLGSELLPTATNVFKNFSGWVASNRVQIKQWAESSAKWIETKGIPALFKIGGEVKSVAERVLHLVEVGARLTGGLGNLALVVGGLRLAPLGLTLGKVGVEGFKAAAALWKYASATKAANAAGGLAGVDPSKLSASAKAIGVLATAQMVIGAAAVGYAIGTALDEYFGLSDKISGWLGKATGQKDKLKGIEDAGVALNKVQLQRKGSDQRYAKFANDALVSSYVKSGLSPDDAVYAANHGGQLPSTPRTGGAAATHIAPVIHINGARTRADVAKGMDHAKHKVLEEFDKREAYRRRVSLAQ